MIQPDNQNYIKKRKIILEKSLKTSREQYLIQDILSQLGVYRCMIEINKLTIFYNLQETDLYHILRKICILLQNSGTGLNKNILNIIKYEFIYFIEKNEKDNMNKHSLWYSRFHDIYIDMYQKKYKKNH